MIHEKVTALFHQKQTTGEMKREFRNKTEQFREMYASMETMKEMSTKDDAKESLVKQQEVVLEHWAEFDLDFVERLLPLSEID